VSFSAVKLCIDLALRPFWTSVFPPFQIKCHIFFSSKWADLHTKTRQDAYIFRPNLTKAAALNLGGGNTQVVQTIVRRFDHICLTD
jgi:hypothetical protein